MSAEKYLSFRGDIKAIVGVGGTIAFVTTHPESKPGGLYRLDADKLTLNADPLPMGGLALIEDGGSLWVAGGDAYLYTAPASSGSPRILWTKLEDPVTALAPLAESRLAMLIGSRLYISNRADSKDGAPSQAFDLPEPGTCLAADPTGRWLAAGTNKGTVAVFDAEGKSEFVPSSSAKLHEGAVSALLFEPDDLRFFSAGVDLKLLSTHARGKLEPEDKGRGNNHTDVVTSLIWGPGERLYSGSRDTTIKSWPRTGAVKPATIKDGVGRVVALAIVTVHERPRLVAACDDNTLRFFPIDAAGKIGELSLRLYDAYAQAKHELSQDEAPRREAALKRLAGFGDARALDLINEQVGSDTDHALRLLGAETLAASSHPKATAKLESCLSHGDEAVRVTAFRGLRRHLGAANLRPIDLALKTEKADIGKLAVEALETLAAKDDQALARLTSALDSKTAEVRQAALVALESSYDKQSPEANLVALGSKHADVRRSALIRLYRRGLLVDPLAQSALRRSTDDGDPAVRQSAFLLTLHTRARLLQALRLRDPELQRQLLELEGTTPEAESASSAQETKRPGKAIVGKILGLLGEASSAKETRPKGKAADAPLDESDIEPLLQASAARSLDTCLRGARGLAILSDPRAFGLLLQLSREDDKGARAEVCRAMAALDDVRAVERLRSMLYDAEAEVRDAAFTALARIHQAEPLAAAESGLNAAHVDVRRRGLQVLVDEARKPSGGEGARQLLARTLNDSFPVVRSEAFKAVLSLQAGGSGAGTLRFANRSLHPDIRREVLTEVMAQVAEPWGLDLLLEFFNDPDPALRTEAFNFALKKSKGLEFLDAALGSRYPDLRMKAVEGLVKKHTNAAQTLLARALDDEDAAVRKAALTSLVNADALPILAPALDNTHPDVRLRVAKAFARHGDPRALAPLLALATAPEPAEKERVADWLSLAESALDGLGELADPAALTHLIPLIDSPHAALRKEAALALARVSTEDRTDALRHALRHADPEVKYRAAFGLACLGDASVSSLVFSDEGAKIISLGGQIAAALALGASGEDRLVVFLDHAKEEVRSRALLLLMMREWKDPRETPTRALACLSSQSPRLRLAAARGIEALAEPATFVPFVASLVNDKGDKPAWQVPESTIDDLAELLIHGDHQLQVRIARILRHLEAEKQDAFDQAWKLHEARFAKELAVLRAQARKRRPVRSPLTAAQLQDLAFGAYVGLVREQGSKAKKPNAPDPQANKVRQSALAHLLRLARVDPRHARAALPVFVQALGDPNQDVRCQAFDQAQALGMPASRLAAEALSFDYPDLGDRGLKLLTSGTSEAEGQAILEQVMLTRQDDLAIQAANQLIARLGLAAIASRLLEAANERLRRGTVGLLGAEYDKDPGARDPLRRALGSKYAAIREAAAFELASKKDGAAFPALVALLGAATEPKAQRRVIEAIEALGDARGAAALLDRAADDPAGTALTDDLLLAASRFRRTDSVDRVLAIIGRYPKRRDTAFSALHTISGYDQRILDPEDVGVDDDWLRKQHPRVDDLLARLIDYFSAPGDAKLLARLIPGARWSRSKVVDPALAPLVNHPDEAIRHEVVKALAWRLRKREGDPEPLRKVLGHRDPTTQFLAASGLAYAGRPDGLNILLASIDFATDLNVRQGAVFALGELADERAFETLLRLAGEDGHALQEAASEAIGHMGRSPRADEVLKLLERQVKGNTRVAQQALKGLRWLNTRPAWELIRQRASDLSCPFRQDAVELLGYNDDPATRDLLLKWIATLGAGNEGMIHQQAFRSARRVFGLDSLEPDYAALQNENASKLDEFNKILERVQNQGEPSRIFAILPRCSRESRESLQACLLNRAKLPVAEAKAALDSPDPGTAAVAARVLGRAGNEAADAAPDVAAAISRWRTAWDDQRLSANQARGGSSQSVDRLVPLTSCVQALVWAAGRLNVSGDVLIAFASARPDDEMYRPIRREAVLVLASGAPTAEILKALEAAALAGDSETRAIAAQAVARLDPARAGTLSERLLTDSVSFGRLTLERGVNVEPTVRTAARQVHSQGMVLADVIEQGDVATLSAVLDDRNLPEVARLGALEGLAAMSLESAETALRKVGSDAKEDEEFRKAAWRSLRRSKRARAKAGRAKIEANP